MRLVGEKKYCQANIQKDAGDQQQHAAYKGGQLSKRTEQDVLHQLDAQGDLEQCQHGGQREGYADDHGQGGSEDSFHLGVVLLKWCGRG
jgi:hypothetical protein